MKDKYRTKEDGMAGKFEPEKQFDKISRFRLIRNVIVSIFSALTVTVVLFYIQSRTNNRPPEPKPENPIGQLQPSIPDTSVRSNGNVQPDLKSSFIVILASGKENKLKNISDEADRLQKKLTKEKLSVYLLKSSKRVAIGTEPMNEDKIPEARAKEFERFGYPNYSILPYNKNKFEKIYDASQKEWLRSKE